jgi:NCAIR mutase (PurE)-related protein
MASAAKLRSTLVNIDNGFGAAAALLKMPRADP